MNQVQNVAMLGSTTGTRSLLVAAVALLAAACGSSPTGPNGAASGPLRIVADSIVTLTVGESMTLRLELDGGIQPGSSATWSTNDASIATVGADGTISGRAYGEALVTSRLNAATATVRIWVQLPESQPSTYRITFVFAGDVHPAWREAYEWAAERWSQVIRTALPAYDLTGHSFCKFPAGIPPIAGQETGTRVVVLTSPNSNSGGPCVRRAMPRPTTVLGVIEASHGPSIDLNSPLTNVRGTAMHELGHVLGLVGMMNEAVPWFDPRTSRYTGVFALEGYRRVFGTSVPYLELLPGNWHWRGFIGEMMTSPPSGGITTISVGALMDIGYPAAWYGADK